MTRPVFADPKTGFVFQRIFGSEDHKPVLLGFLNDLLELDDAHRIRSVSLLPAEQRPKVAELEYSIVDVRRVRHRAVRRTQAGDRGARCRGVEGAAGEAAKRPALVLIEPARVADLANVGSAAT